MDWQALTLSLRLAAWTSAILLPIGVVVARTLAFRRFPAKGFVEALIVLPLVLPPTVLGYYMLVAMGNATPIGQAWQAVTGDSLVFTFEGLLIASVIFNLPFAIQPLQRAFDTIPASLREAAWVSGMSSWTTFFKVELPLAWPGFATAFVLTVAHTLGEFGVVLMVGGSIPGETKTIAIAIYDRVEAFEDEAAGMMSAFLLIFSFATIAIMYLASKRMGRDRG